MKDIRVITLFDDGFPSTPFNILLRKVFITINIMTDDDKQFLIALFTQLGYDVSDDAPPIHEQFYERHKESIQKAKKVWNDTSKLTEEEKKERLREFRRRHAEKIRKNRK
jgi:hypothetical protein